VTTQAPRGGIEIRPATSDDVAEVARILADAGDPVGHLAFGRRAERAHRVLVARDIEAPGVRVLVATVADQVAGVAVTVGEARDARVHERDLRLALGRRRAAWAAFALRAASHAGLAPGEVYLETLAVKRAARRAGVGLALLEQVRADGESADLRLLTFWIAETNTPCRLLVERAGAPPQIDARTLLLPGWPWRLRTGRFAWPLTKSGDLSGTSRALARENS
jgi:ribosomal protein S18 acetylase RimI-like enzyme